MKKIIKYTATIVLVLTLFTGCEKWLDVNTNPNAIVDSPAITEAIYLIGVEAEWAEKAIIMYPWWNAMSDMILWYSIQQSTPRSFIIDPGYGNIIWDSYSGSLKHAVALYDKAKANGNFHYQGIAGVIAAWHWFLIADLYDQAPLEQAMKGSEHRYPDVATQPEIYEHANNLLIEAISLFDGPFGELKPGSDDYMLDGDMAAWKRLAYAMRARYAMRLTYAEGTTPAAQADLVLGYLTNAMQPGDMVAWQHGTDQANWSWIYSDGMLYDYSAEGMTPNIELVDLMNDYNDPRRAVMFSLAEAGGYKGLRSGAAVAPGDKPSRYSWDFCTQDYPDIIMMYHECLFLKAEAYALKGDYPNCQLALNAAVRADMEFHSVDEADIVTYLAQPTMVVPTNVEGAQRLVMEQKYIANVYETYESYFDIIRTGYPTFDYDYAIENVANANTYPRRYMYPLDEMDKNPNISAIGQPDYLVRGTSWDRKTFSWRP
ncbi:MAG: SusD/RagB family nutrient-binding outer membrane lipoprotein [Bacteroidales bacterium]|nr:SusD/RagB family nutrient-binding outer membrane lipoprotein [Bacteroidales bacterium]